MKKKYIAIIAVIALVIALFFIGRALLHKAQEPIAEPVPGSSVSVPDSSTPVSSAKTDRPESNPDPGSSQTEPSSGSGTVYDIDKDGSYTTKEDVALYIYVYGELPHNFITKSEAKKLGWDSGSLEKYAPGCAIGGDRFGNREGRLPEAPGRQYYECDINTVGKKSRGAERIVFSNDGLIYYTGDHYETFELLYGEE
ncbi:MAG: ribonuclease [Oscillospiraceae bacterium]|nr:ribonuclease [Oscillospiraceae bacterium]